MYKLIIDHRVGRKAAQVDEVFDLGAGHRNCIECTGRSHLADGLGYICTNFADVITGAYRPAAHVRMDEEQCGAEAIGFVRDPDAAPMGFTGACCDCAHSVAGKERNPLAYKYCARAINPGTGELHLIADVRGDEALCGASGAWFTLAPGL